MKDMISTYTHFIEHRNQRLPEPIIHEIPKIPLTKVATDIFYLYNNAYVVTIDCSTKYFNIHKLENCESPTGINKINNTFARLGIPQKVISDNGPIKFKQFAKEWDSKHITRILNFYFTDYEKDY